VLYRWLACTQLLQASATKTLQRTTFSPVSAGVLADVYVRTNKKKPEELHKELHKELCMLSK
jgi:hypothetical protein